MSEEELYPPEEELYPPEEDEVEEQLLVCWKDANRACGPDCIAYDHRAEDNERYRPCLLLNVQRQQANALVNLANEMKRRNDFCKSKADRENEKMAGVWEQFRKFRQQQEEVDKLPDPPEIKI